MQIQTTCKMMQKRIDAMKLGCLAVDDLALQINGVEVSVMDLWFDCVQQIFSGISGVFVMIFLNLDKIEILIKSPVHQILRDHYHKPVQS